MKAVVAAAVAFFLAGPATAADPKAPAAQKPAAGAKLDPTQPKDNQAYLEQAAKEKGATKTPSGLVYVEQKKGTGAQPTAANKVRVHYRGTLVNGTEFDSSYKRNEPAEFPLGGVIPCWTEGLQKMKEGGKAKLVCPSNIAYGGGGIPGVIPPNATLVFDVELLKVL